MIAIQLQNKRVGSTFLQQAIDSHPDIVGIDEVFVNIARRMNIRKSGFVPYINSDINTPKEYIEDVLHKTYPDKHIIFKLMHNQVYYHDGLVDVIKEYDIPIIHVMRRNIVKQVVSFLKMADYNHAPLSITPKDFYTLVEDAHYNNKFIINEFKNQIKLTLFYEDIIGSSDGERTYVASDANSKICDFFEVPYQRLFAKTKKKLKRDMNFYIPNIEKVLELFNGTRYEWMIKENLYEERRY